MVNRFGKGWLAFAAALLLNLNLDLLRAAPPDWCEAPREVTRLLRQMGPPTYKSVHSQPFRPEALAAGLRSEFAISGKPLKPGLPIDWNQDPYQDRSWRFWLHSLFILEPLLQGYEQRGSLEGLMLAKSIFVDWIKNNPLGDQNISEFAWYDMAVGARAAYLGYLIRASAFEQRLTQDDACVLGRSAERHGNWLADSANYYAGHNHGLYQDAGLFALADSLPASPLVKRWKRIARERFVDTVQQIVQPEESLHLEHSPAYHHLVTDLIARFRRFGIDGPNLDQLISRMKRNRGWLIMPDRRFPQLGDTDLGPQLDTPRLRGTKIFRKSGFGIVSEESSYLILTAGYHSSGHKHADELSFCLYDQWGRIIVDSGRYGYYYKEPGRIYAESSPAHNTVVFNDHPFTWRGQRPYGSGILGGARFKEWSAIAAENPLVRQQGIRHRRFLVFKPGHVLLVIDHVKSAYAPQATRFFHFAPDLKLEQESSRQIRFSNSKIRGRMCDASADESTASQIVVGRREPNVQGFTFPGNRRWVANATAIFKTRVEGDLLVTVFDLNDGYWCANPLAWTAQLTEGKLTISHPRFNLVCRLNILAFQPGIQFEVSGPTAQ